MTKATQSNWLDAPRPVPQDQQGHRKAADESNDAEPPATETGRTEGAERDQWSYTGLSDYIAGVK